MHRFVCLGLLAAALAIADDATVPAPPASGQSAVPELQVPESSDQPLALKEATRIGVALGAAQRCGMAAEEIDTLTKLGRARLQQIAKDRTLYARAVSAMGEARRWGATQMRQPAGGCAAVLPIVSGILGNLTYLVVRADPDVPELHRASPLENFAAWAGQLAAMASNCGAQDQVVDHGVDLARQYIDREAKDARAQELAATELSQMMLQAVLERWGDPAQCVTILTEFGTFFGNLDARLPLSERAQPPGGEPRTSPR